MVSNIYVKDKRNEILRRSVYRNSYNIIWPALNTMCHSYYSGLQTGRRFKNVALTTSILWKRVFRVTSSINWNSRLIDSNTSYKPIESSNIPRSKELVNESFFNAQNALLIKILQAGLCTFYSTSSVFIDLTCLWIIV